jgi:phage baseplate assembly protein W
MSTVVSGSNPYIDASSTNESDRSAQIFKDLNLNFIIHPLRKDVSQLTDVEAIKRSMRNLIYINVEGKYEKPFHPEIGTGIRDSLFEINDPFARTTIENKVRYTIDNFEPRVDLVNVTVDTDSNENEIKINLEFYIKNVPTDLIEYETILKRVR